ncbi:MAG: DNA polymerase III subunit beta [Andreesenia angusta]|nr:DNA polymerase III subunit beta [Andreesenia angusta]
MKITISQKEFNKSLSNALKIVERSTTMPILKGIKLEVKDNRLYISATDLLISIESSISGLDDEYENGSLVVESANILLEIIKRLPDENIKLNTDLMNNLNVHCNYSDFTLNGLSSDEYPEWPEVDSNQSFQIEKDLLMDMISKTEFAISNDQARPVLTGALLEIDNNEIVLVSLDGYRLAVRKSKLDNFDKNISIIIPGKAIRKLLDILKTIKTDSENIEIKSSENHIVINMGETTMVSRLLDGHFLSYKDIIRNEYNTKVTIDKNDFKLALERASYIDREGHNSLIKLKIESDRLVIRSNSDTGDINEIILCEIEGEPIEIAFNTRYILDGVKVIDTEKINMYLIGDVHPCIINPENDPMYTYLILPVRLA